MSEAPFGGLTVQDIPRWPADGIPRGQHWADSFLIALHDLLGYEKASWYLGLDPATGEPPLVGRVADACEWNPVESRGAYDTDTFHSHAQVLVGANGTWRLCATCARLPVFSRYRRRDPIR